MSLRHLIVFTFHRLDSVAACDQLDYTNENWDALGECGWHEELTCPVCEVLRVTALANGFDPNLVSRSLTLAVIWHTNSILGLPPVTVEEANWLTARSFDEGLKQGSNAHGSST
jgi:hypothetical protein